MLNVESVLNFKTVQKLISLIPPEVSTNLILIGGQALSIWGKYYILDELTGEEYEHLTSYDLDFFGKEPDIKKCAEAWGGQTKYPTLSDNTPASGIVQISQNDGTVIVVDFLNHVYGLDNENELSKYCDAYFFGEVRIPILSPPLCLKSRIHNLRGLGYSDKKEEREVVIVFQKKNLAKK